MDRPEIPAHSQSRYNEIAALLEVRAGVKASSMFGMPTLKLDGKALAGLYGDAMVFKLSGEAHAEALSLRDAHLFDPSGLGRPMKAWVVVPIAHAANWEHLAELALVGLDP